MYKILIVDDEVFIRDGLKQLLEMDGHKVDIAGDGKEAVKLILKNQYNLVITDIIMPEKDGIEVIMKAKEKDHDIKVIAISGGGRISAKDHLKVAKQLGADTILSKPFSTEELTNEINRIMSA